MIRSITDPSQRWRSKFKGATSRNFESFSVMYKITSNVRETTKYQFCNMEKHQNGKNEPKRNKNSEGWRRLTWISNDQLEKCRLNFSRCANRDVAPLKFIIRKNNPHCKKVHGSSRMY